MPKTPQHEPGSLAIVGTAEIRGEGKAAKDRTFVIVGYSGEPLVQGWWDAPVVVDMDGIEAGDGVLPILDNHGGGMFSDKSPRESVVGQSITAKVEKGKFVLRGKMIEATEASKEVIKLADAGFRWQASIGASCEQKDFIAEDNEVKCNGRTYQGPVYVSRKTVIREVSFVVIGADSKTSALVATGAKAMKFEEFVKDLGLEASALTPELRAKYEVLYAKACKADEDMEASEDEGDEPDPDGSSNPDDDEPADKPKKTKARAKPARASGRPNKKANADIMASYREEAAAEMKRHRRIREICAGAVGATYPLPGGEKVPLAEHAITAGWTAQKTELEALKWIRAAAPIAPVTWYAPSAPELNEAVLEAAVLQAGKCQLQDNDFYFTKGERRIKESLQKKTMDAMQARYTDQVQQTAHTMFRGGIRLQQVLVAGARSGGYQGGEVIGDGNIEDVLRAAFDPRIRAEGASTVSIQNTLANVLNKFLLQGYLFVEQAYKEISASRSVKDFKPTKSINVFGDFVYKKLGSDGEIKHASMTDEGFANQIDTFARRLQLTRQTIIDDDLNALTTIPVLMGIGSADAINILFWTTFLSLMGNGPDGAAFWATRNVSSSGLGGGALQSNYQSGAGTVLSSASMQTGVALFDKQVKPNGQPLGLEAEILLVPPELWVPGWELTDPTASQLIYGGSTAAKQTNANIWRGQFKLVKSRYLSNPSYTGNSATAWYLLGNPQMCPVIEIAYLNGQETPTVQTANANFETLGIQIRGYHDFGVAPQNTRGGVKSAGA